MSIPEVAFKKWYGRLGNNLCQIRNAIRYCKDKSGLLILMEHSFLRITPKKRLDFRKRPTRKNKRINENFYYYYEPKIINDEVRKIYAAYIHQMLPPCPKELKTKMNQISDLTLVIHIRSGDIFSAKIPNRYYVPSPVTFFQTIINQHPPEYQIILVTERDKVNPVINKLQELYQDRITIQSGSLLEDFYTIYLAKNVVIGIGTFAKEIAFLSPIIKNVYSFRNGYNVKFTDQQWHIYNCQNYIPEHKWRNTPDQLNKMMNTDLTQIVKIK